MKSLGRKTENVNAQACSIVKFTQELKKLMDEINGIIKSLTEEVGAKDMLLQERARELEEWATKLKLKEDDADKRLKSLNVGNPVKRIGTSPTRRLHW